MQEENKNEEALSILNFEVENVKRAIKIKVSPAPLGLTSLNGSNRAGKTSALEAVAHAIFGPSTVAKGTQLINDNATQIEGTRGAMTRTRVELTNGTIIERRLTAKNNRTGILEITLPDGSSGTIENIKESLSEIALNPPSIGDMSERERLKYFLKGLNIDISELEAQLKRQTEERQALYVEKERMQKHANDLPFTEGLATTEIPASTVMAELQKAMETNSKNNTIRHDLVAHAKKVDNAIDFMKSRSVRIAELNAMLETAKTEESNAITEWSNTKDQLAEAEKSATNLVDIPTDALQQKLKDTEAMNTSIRQNIVKAQKVEDADVERKKWTAKGVEMNETIRSMSELINSADCPIKSLGVNEDMQLTMDGKAWSGMSGMQKKVAETAIASLYNNNARIVFMDGLEQFDEDAIQILNKWAMHRKLQIIASKVGKSTAGDGIVEVLIENGRSVETKTEKDG